MEIISVQELSHTGKVITCKELTVTEEETQNIARKKNGTRKVNKGTQKIKGYWPHFFLSLQLTKLVEVICVLTEHIYLYFFLF